MRRQQGIYRKQGRYFREAYRTGDHGWPMTGATPEVARFVRQAKRHITERRAIDIGCGEGRHSILLAQEGFDVDAFDLVPEAVAKARRFAREAGVAGRIRFRIDDVLAINGKNDYALAVDYGCFHHLVSRDWKRYLRAVDGLLGEGGHLILSVFTPKYRHKDGSKPRDGKWLVHKGHYDRFFRPPEIRAIFGNRFIVKSMREDNAGFCHALMIKKS